MYKAIIFDFFGVLSSRTLGPFVEKYIASDPEKLEEAKKLREQGDMGQISRDELIEQLARLAHVPVQEAIEYTSRLEIDEELTDYIRKVLKPKYKISILSNSAGNYAGEIMTKDDLALFDDILVSYKFGMIKPEPDIFKLAAERLDVKPEECVFIDDKELSAKSAEMVGMKGVWYRGFGQFKTDLEAILQKNL